MTARAEAYTLQQCAAALPDLQWQVVTGHSGSMNSLTQDAHPLAGAGKLLFSICLAEEEESAGGVMSAALEVSEDHRSGAESGTLRLMKGEVRLRVEDAIILVLSTGDAAAARALVDHSKDRGVDLLSTARQLVMRMGLSDTDIVDLDTDALVWGDIFSGTTSCTDLCQVLRALLPQSSSQVLSAQTAHRVRRWMSSVFEPAGLACALPGFGPHRTEAATLSGWELTALRVQEQGCTSVLLVETPKAEWVAAAAHYPAELSRRETADPAEPSTQMGSLGLAAFRAGGSSGEPLA